MVTKLLGLGYEMVRNGIGYEMVLGTKWYEFWVRNYMPGVGISTRTCITSILQYRCAALVGLKGILWSNIVTM